MGTRGLWGLRKKGHTIAVYHHFDSYCKDNTYGRPCVRAFNKMCRELRIAPDYTDFDFSKWWYWRGE